MFDCLMVTKVILVNPNGYWDIVKRSTSFSDPQ